MCNLGRKFHLLAQYRDRFRAGSILGESKREPAQHLQMQRVSTRFRALTSSDALEVCSLNDTAWLSITAEVAIGNTLSFAAVNTLRANRRPKKLSRESGGGAFPFAARKRGKRREIRGLLLRS